jgi:drug/metabolite transporter (DMT)-like permease
MKIIPLAKATVLFYTNPIFIAVFGWFILKEHITIYDMFGVATTFIGVVIFTLDPFSSK